MSEMIEHVAQDIAISYGYRWNRLSDSEDTESGPSRNGLRELASTAVTSLSEPTDEMIEAGAHAAWVEYTGRDGSEEWMEDSWPETHLYPNADDFRRCAKACFIAMMKVAGK